MASDETTLASPELFESLKGKALDESRLLDIRANVYGSGRERRRLERQIAAAESGPSADEKETALAIALGRFACGRSADAIPALEKAKSSKIAAFALAHALLDTNRPAEAREVFEKEGDSAPWRLGQLEALEREGDLAGLAKKVQSWQRSLGDDPDYLYYQGLLQERTGDLVGALALYEKAIDAAPRHSRSLFRLAYIHDMRGDDERAIEFYERATRGRPALANAFINLGVIHEDRAEYEKAIECFKTVVEIDPSHQRARMFLKDALASLDMYYDEEQERREDKLQQILKIPVTDFELSVRSRNCLEKMKIRTLGDLITKSEDELLSYKNFGETSLMEIKEILASKNLRLGMGRSDDPERMQRVKPEIEQLKRLVTGTSASSDVVVKPVADLDLSVRSRRCMSKLGITTVGELIQRSVDELMATKNFGATSLREVREKLRALGLSLKDDSET